MKIVAIGSIPLDLELGCFATLSKYIRQGHDVSLIIAKENTEASLTDWDQMTMEKMKESSKDIGITEVHFTDRFDYSAVTQDNANVLNSLIKIINPSLIIMPFWKAINNKRRILAKTSLIACRGFGNILMYELEENTNFIPTVYFQVSAQDIYAKKSCLLAYSNLLALTTNEDEYNITVNKTDNNDVNLPCKKSHQFLSLSQEHAEPSYGISEDIKTHNDIYDGDEGRMRFGYLNYPFNACLDKLENRIIERKGSSNNNNYTNLKSDRKIATPLLQQIIVDYSQNRNRKIPIEVFESHRMLLLEDSMEF